MGAVRDVRKVTQLSWNPMSAGRNMGTTTHILRKAVYAAAGKGNSSRSMQTAESKNDMVVIF